VGYSIGYPLPTHVFVNKHSCGKGVPTRRSSPDSFRFAQSSAPCPGASATFLLFFVGFGGAFVVEGGSASEEDGLEERDTPTDRLARLGSGGGGISSVSVSILGRVVVGMGVVGVDIRWALESAGNAGGVSSSSFS
jgi:hypothetical protein